jgi:hypothetical protein
VGSKGPHHGRRQIVLAVDAARIATRNEKERGRLFDHNAPNVSVPANASPILDVQAEAEQIGHLLSKPGRIVLTASSLGEPLGLGAVSSVVHRHAP